MHTNPDTPKRRARGTGSVQQKCGTYYAVWKGRWHKAGVSSHEAERLLEQLRAADTPIEQRLVDSLATGAAERAVADGCSAGQPITFGHFASQFIDTIMAAPSAPGSKPAWVGDQVRITRNTLIPALGDRLMADFEPADAFQYVEARIEGWVPIRPGSRTKKDVCPKTALNELRVLSKICERAKFSGYIAENPCLAISAEAQKQWPHVARSRVFLTRSQLDELLAKTPPEHRVMILLMGRVGLRLGEVLGLRMSSYDPSTKLLKVDQAWTHAREVAPKSARSARSLLLGKDVKRAVEDAIVRAGSIPKRHRLIVPGPAGGFMDPGHWREHVFHPAVAAAVTPVG